MSKKIKFLFSMVMITSTYNIRASDSPANETQENIRAVKKISYDCKGDSAVFLGSNEVKNVDKGFKIVVKGISDVS